jgi:hypothetical protein
MKGLGPACEYKRLVPYKPEYLVTKARDAG